MMRWPRWTWMVAVILLAALLAGVSQAQTPEGRPGGPGRGPRMGGGGFAFGGVGGGGGGLLRLLAVEQVRKEVKLDEEQVNQLKDLEQDLRNLMPRERGAMRDLSDEERRARFEDIRKKAAEVEKQVEDVLDADQLKRLKQISLQLRLNMQGAGVFSDPALVKALEISEGQLAKLRALQGQVRDQMRETRPGGRNREEFQNLNDQERRALFEQMRTKMEEARKQCMNQAMDLLTPAQKEKLAELKGAEFKLDMSQLRGPFGPGRGRGPGGSGRRGEGGPRRGPSGPSPNDPPPVI